MYLYKCQLNDGKKSAADGPVVAHSQAKAYRRDLAPDGALTFTTLISNRNLSCSLRRIPASARSDHNHIGAAATQL